MKRTITTLALVSVLALTACGADENGVPVGSNLYEVRHTLEDGRTVTCIVHKGAYAGGLSCDWEGATRG